METKVCNGKKYVKKDGTVSIYKQTYVKKGGSRKLPITIVKENYEKASPQGKKLIEIMSNLVLLHEIDQDYVDKLLAELAPAPQETS